MTWADGVLCGFDTETTGTDPETARIVSAAIMLDSPGSGKRLVKSWLANPGVDIPLEATAVHGISNEQAQKQGQNPGAVVTGVLAALAGIRERYGQVPLVIFNAPYDLTVLERESRRNGIPVPAPFPAGLPVIDPLVCDRKLDPYRRGWRTLTAVAAAYGVVMSGAHTADGDTLVTVRLARAMAARFPRFGSAEPSSLQTMQRQASRDWAAHFQDYRRKADAEFVCDGSWPYRPYHPPVLVP